MSSPVTAELLEFFDRVWGDNEGYVYLPVKEQLGDGKARVRKFFLQWPEKRDAVARHVLKWAAVDACEVFFSPALYKSMSAKNENVLGSQVAWAEFDGNYPVDWPEDVAPRPTVEVRSSSEKNRHCYWVLDEFVGPKQVEELNRALAYALSADTSGWDANQFLRPPFSVHRKGKPISVKVVADHLELAPYSVGDFEHIPAPKDAVKEKIDLDNLPSIDDVRSMAKWDEDMLDLFNTTGKVAQRAGWDRSGGLARLAYKGAELAWADDQIMAALLDADDRWGKYRGRSTRNKILTELINRARAKIGYDVTSDKVVLSKLLKDTKAEVKAEDELPDFFSIDEINALPGIDDWLVEGLLTEDGVGLITGRPGTGKTQLTLQLAADLACGRDKFLDYVLPNEPKKVLYLSLEMSAYQLQHFTTPLRKRYQEKELRNLVVYGKGEPLFLNQENGQNLFESWLDEHNPDVVIVDSLSQATTDLSGDEEMTELFAFLKRLRRFHRFGMVFIHHHRKKANDAQSRKQANSQSDIYGSYQIAATIDFALDLEDRNDDNGYLDLHLLKARYRPVGDPEKIMRDNDLHFHLTENIGLLTSQDFDAPTENGDDDDRKSLAV